MPLYVNTWAAYLSRQFIDNLLALSHLYHVQMEDLLVYEEAEMASSCFLRMYRGNTSDTVSGYACTAA